MDAALNRVARELGRAYPELGDEFALTAIELAFLTERRQAFETLAYRVNLDAAKGVVTTMVQTERYGTPLASALRGLCAGALLNERACPIAGIVTLLYKNDNCMRGKFR